MCPGQALLGIGMAVVGRFCNKAQGGDKGLDMVRKGDDKVGNNTTKPP